MDNPQLKSGTLTAWTLISILLLTVNTSCRKNISTGDSARIDSVSFIVIGDWGLKGAEAQLPVADQMSVYAKTHNVQFVITAGDNFYPSSVFGTSDAHWQLSFEDVYNKESLQVPWYPVLGNHDYKSNPQAEIEYSLISNRWKMPSRYYTVEKNIDATHSVLFVFTDTTPFVNSSYGAGMADLQQQDTAAQLAWLRTTLSTSKDTWKIVIGHHPLYSAGPRGNTPELIARFKQIFLQTKTNFYICGHDHNLQHLALLNGPVQYLVSGGGGHLPTYPVYPNPFILFGKSSPGFMGMVLYASNANLYFYDDQGVLLYRQQIRW